MSKEQEIHCIRRDGQKGEQEVSGTSQYPGHVETMKTTQKRQITIIYEWYNTTRTGGQYHKNRTATC